MTRTYMAGVGEALTIHIVPEAVISGRVVDQNGEGISGFSVSLWARDGLRVDGVRESQKNYRTGAGGAFRIDKLPAGRYFVCAVPEVHGPGTDDRSYFPITCSSPNREQPDWIVLKAGESHDVILRVSPRLGVIVSGKLTQPEPGLSFFMGSRSHAFLANRDGAGAEKWNGKTGEFEFDNVPPGDYDVEVLSEDNKRNAAKIVSVASQDIRNLQLSLHPLPVLTGRMRTGDGSALPSVEHYRGLTLDFLGRHWNSISISPEVSKDGAFRAELRLPGRYQFNIYGPVAVDASGWWIIKSATQHGKDVLSEDIVVDAEDPAPIDITLTREHGSLEARVLGAIDANTRMYMVALRRFGTRLRWVAAGNVVYLERAAAGQYVFFARAPQCEILFSDAEFLEKYKQYANEAVVENGRVTKVEVQPIPCVPPLP